MSAGSTDRADRAGSADRTANAASVAGARPARPPLPRVPQVGSSKVAEPQVLERAPRKSHFSHFSPFVPLLLIGLAVVTTFGFQTFELVQERGRLLAARVAQQEAVAGAQKMRGQLDAIATGAQKLADAGNTGAVLVVNALKERGVTIGLTATGGRIGQ